MNLLGIDAGTTVTKAVVIDPTGRELAVASRRVPLSYPQARHVERDQDALWDAVIETVREVLKVVPAREIGAVGVTSHGDGIYLVDAVGRPTRPGIMSLDTRARGIVSRWEKDGVSDRALPLAGQRPWPSAPSAIIRWLVENEPEVISRSRWALPAKDMLRHRLTGVFSTELTEASLSFTNVRTQEYDQQIIGLYGLSDVAHLLPDVLPSIALSGRVTAEAAEATGLLEGTPVGASAHDVDCSAIGTGVIAPGVASVVAGSFSINQVVSDEAVVGAEWCARNFVQPGTWMNMSLSPTSAANMEWFVQNLCADEVERGRSQGDPLGFVEQEVRDIADDPSDIVFLPFLYGSPFPGESTGTFMGLRGWHRRGHLLRAVMEGVMFTHRHHVDALAASFTFDTVRLTGGASRSDVWCQLFADGLGRRVEITGAQESGALGAALLAGVAAGQFADLDDAVRATVHVERVFTPRTDAVQRLDAAYTRFREVIVALGPIWEGTSR